MKCNECFYSGWDIVDGERETVMVCKRYAPRIIHGSGTGWSSQQFPIVSSENWCGEFRPDTDKEER